MGRRGSVPYPDYSRVIQESKLKEDYSFTRVAGFDYNYDPADTTYARGKVLPFDPYSDEVVEEKVVDKFDYLRRDEAGPSRAYTPPPAAASRVARDSPRRPYTPPPPPPRGQAQGQGQGGHVKGYGTEGGHGRARGGRGGGGGKRRRPSPDYSDYRPQRRGSPDYSPYEELPGAKPAAVREIHTSAVVSAPHSAPATPKLLVRKPFLTSLSPLPESLRPAPSPPPPPPGPSEEYIQISQIPSEPLNDPSSQRKLLVLDLNGTLVFRSAHRKREWRPCGELDGSQEGGEQDPYADPTLLRPLRTVHGRPFLKALRDYLFHPSTKKWLDTMVWSSAQPHSVDDMVDKAFGEKKEGLLAVWARDTLGLREDQYNRKVQTTKDLTKPWENLTVVPSADTNTSADSTKPEIEHKHSARTTFLLDDSPLKAQLHPWNHLCIKEYAAETRAKDVQIRDAVVHAQRMREHAAELAASEQMDEVEEVEAMLGSEDVSEAETDTPQTVVADSVSPVPAPEPEKVAEAEAGKKRKREKKLKKKLEAAGASMQLAIDPNLPDVEAGYDRTLLAVIGILDAAKQENNIAAWMKNGGLVNVPVEVKPDQGEAAAADGTATAEAGEATEVPKKRRRLSDENEVGTEDEGIVRGSSPPPSGPSSSEAAGSNGPPSPATSSLSVEEEAAQATSGVPMSATANGASAESAGPPKAPPLWFDLDTVVEYWAHRGVKALEDLEIKAEARIVGSSG